MNKKTTIILIFVLFLITLLIQLLSVSLINDVSVNIYSIIAALSIIPFAGLVFLITKLIKGKHRILVLLLRWYSVVLIILFVIIFLIAITIGFERDYTGGAVLKL